MEYSTSVTAAEYKSQVKLTKDTPYLSLLREIWDVFSEDFGENWLHFNESCPNGQAMGAFCEDFAENWLCYNVENFWVRMTCRCKILSGHRTFYQKKKKKKKKTIIRFPENIISHLHKKFQITCMASLACFLSVSDQRNSSFDMTVVSITHDHGDVAVIFLPSEYHYEPVTCVTTWEWSQM